MYIHIFAANKINMKKIILLLAAVIGMNTALLAEDGKGKATINTSKSTFTWVGEKVVMGSHTGNIGIKSGMFNMKDNTITGGSFVIDMTSMTCTDIEDAETNGKLLGHLKSDDFFSVANHNTANFEITKAEKKSDNMYNITGKLTIKGITNEISFPAKVDVKGNEVHASADFSVNRTKWNIKYGSGSFFDGLGDRAISDEFKVSIVLVANK